MKPNMNYTKEWYYTVIVTTDMIEQTDIHTVHDSGTPYFSTGLSVFRTSHEFIFAPVARVPLSVHHASLNTGRYIFTT